MAQYLNVPEAALLIEHHSLCSFLDLVISLYQGVEALGAQPGGDGRNLGGCGSGFTIAWLWKSH